MGLPFDPAISLLGIYPKNPETPVQKSLCTPMFIPALFIIAKIWKQPKCPSVDEWVKKKTNRLWYVYTVEYCATEGKNSYSFATAWMELEIIVLNEINQSVKDKNHMISLIRGI